MKQNGIKILILVIVNIGVVFGGWYYYTNIKIKKEQLVVEAQNPTVTYPEKAPEEKEKREIRIPRKTSYTGYLQNAQILAEDKKYSLASLELYEAIKQRPKNPSPYLLLGEVYSLSGEDEKLDRLAQAMEDKFPEHFGSALLTVKQFIRDKKFTEALEYLNTVKQSHEGALPSTLAFYEAVIFSLKNDHKNARSILDYLVRQRTYSEVLDAEENSNAIRYEELQKAKSIRAAYEKFDNLSDGKNPHLFALIAKELAQKLEADLAAAFAEVAIQEDVEYVEGWVLRGYSKYILQKYNEAIMDLRHAYRLDTLRAETQYFLALALLENEDLDEAALFFEKAIEHKFTFPKDAQKKLLQIFLKQKKYDQVMSIYDNIIDTKSESGDFISAIHTSIDLLKQPKKALKFARILRTKDSTSAFSDNINAWALIANKQFSEAKKYLESAEIKDDKNPRTYLNWGLWHESQGKKKRAQEYYKKSYEIGFDTIHQDIANLAVKRYNLLSQSNFPHQEISDKDESSP